MRLSEMLPEAYARDVLPMTFPLWAGRRDLATYIAQTLAIAKSPYGRRHYRTLGLYDGAAPVASFKRYERTVREGTHRLRAFGIGAVYTPPALRGRGYASAMLAAALDRARADGYDVAYLFSDIRPQFYAELGFQALASRELALRADTLPKARVEVARMEERDWNGVRRCFELSEGRRPAAFTRTPLAWEWIRTRLAHGSERPPGDVTNLVVRRGRGIGAYVFGTRMPSRDAFVVDEFGFADEAMAELLPALLRGAAGDLHRLIGWLPPDGARELLPHGSVRKRNASILMLAPLSSAGVQFARTAARPAKADFCWVTDHI